MPVTIKTGYFVLSPLRYGVRKVLVEVPEGNTKKCKFQMLQKGKMYRYNGVIGKNIALNMDDAKRLYDASVKAKIEGLTVYIEQIKDREMRIVDCTD